MSAALDTKQRVLDAAITGVFRVAQAILATPTEKRTKALDAAANSYAKQLKIWITMKPKSKNCST